MGKLKRARQKFHLSRTKAADNTPSDTAPESQAGASNFFALSSVPDNLFSGIEISFEDLKQKLPDTDAKSIISTKQDVFTKSLSKKEKIKLRHEMFIKKLEVVSQLRKEAKSKKKHKQKAKVPSVVGDMKSLFDSLPALKNLSKNKEPIKRVKKSVPKMKRRQKIMLQDISTFKNILTDPQYKADPTGTISSHIQEKILQGAI